MNNHKKKIGLFKIIIGILVVINIALFAFLGKPVLKEKNTNVSLEQSLKGLSGDLIKDRKILKDSLQNHSSEEVYKNVVSSLKNEAIQHNVMHMLGELIYEKEGKKGILICGNDFGFGCYHGFFLSILSAEGFKVVPELDQICVKKYGIQGLGCPHGIGHGILEYLGQDKLVQALNICATLSWKGRLHGCQDGVFMQYNVPLTLSDDKKGLAIRKFDPKNPYYPCDSVPEKFRLACYYSFGQWLKNVFNEDFKRLGKFCGEVSNIDERKVCFRGIGNIIPPPKYSVAQTLTDCGQMPTEEGNTYCKVGAAWSFFADPPHKYLFSNICDSIPVSLKDLCVNPNK